MLELNVNARSPASINTAFKKIKEMVTSGAVSKTTPVHILLEPGSYREIVKYNMSNPLVMEGVSGAGPQDCVIQADNCESFNKGAENRSILSFGPNCTNITLKNFSVTNAHLKNSADTNALSDSAEALSWNNTIGTLFAENMHFEGRKNTLGLKGFSWFLNSYVSGDVDFIYGECDTALFEDCEIHVREDNRGDFDGYAVKSNALAEKSGFVFLSCRFTAEKRRKSSVYVYRTEGRGSSASPKNWDSAAFINCYISDVFDPELAWDDDMSMQIYPRGNAKNGIREYNTRVVTKSGKVIEDDTSRRNIRSYTMTEDDYFRGYASRYLILHDTPFAAITQEI